MGRARNQARGWREHDGAKPAAVRHVPPAPQLPTLTREPPAADDWIHELKFDGYRMLATVQGASVQLWSRHAVNWTRKLEPIARELAKGLRCESAILDGELIAGGGLQSDFHLLQDAIAHRAIDGLTFVAFDLLNLDDVDLRGAPLIERRALLARLLEHAPARVAHSTHVVGRGADALRLSAAGRFEGIVSKRARSSYTPGRSSAWLKTKNHANEQFAVVGFVVDGRDRLEYLLMACPNGGAWRYAGRVRPTREVGDIPWRDLLHEPHAASPSVAVGQHAHLKRARWFPPRFVVEVNSRGIGEKSGFRQATLVAVRMDKTPADLL